MRRLSWILLFCLLLCGCTVNREAPSCDAEEGVVLKYYTIGRADPDLPLVSRALNELLRERYGFTVDYRKIDWNEYENTVNTVIGTNGDFDVLFTWDSHYLTNASRHAFLDLEPYLEHQGFSLRHAVDERLWQGVRVNGKIYGVPTNKELAPVTQFLFSRDLVSKYHLPVEDCRSLSDLEPMLKLMAEQEPDVVPLLFTSERQDLAELIGYEYVVGGKLPFAIRRDDPRCRVVNLYETEEMVQLQQTLRHFYEMGYINQDAALRTGISRFSTEQVFCRIGTGGPCSEQSFSTDFGYPIVSVPVSTPWITNTSARGGIMAICADTEHPREAMAFLTAVNLDPDVRNLLNYGIEGVHYTLTENDQVRVISGGYRGVPYTQGNWFILKTMEGEAPDKWDRYRTYNNQAGSSLLLGFQPDAEGLTLEMQQVAQAYLRYDNALLTGSVDPETYRNRALRQMDLAGEENLRRQLQKQVDAWRASGERKENANG